jgi:hypothetical protein
MIPTAELPAQVPSLQLHRRSSTTPAGRASWDACNSEPPSLTLSFQNTSSTARVLASAIKLMFRIRIAFLILSTVLWSACSRGPAQPEATTIPVTPPPARGISENLKPNGAKPLYNLEWVGSTVNPYERQPVNVSRAGEFKVSGWAVDPQAKTVGQAVDVVVDNVAYHADYSIKRPDVAEYYHLPGYAQAGFNLSAKASFLTPGTHKLVLRIVSSDGTAYYESLPLTLRVD